MKIEWRDDNHVIMSGPTEFEYDGYLDAATGEAGRDGRNDLP